MEEVLKSMIEEGKGARKKGDEEEGRIKGDWRRKRRVSRGRQQV